MEKYSNFTFTKKIFFDLYGVEDYMIHLIELCSTNTKQVKHFTKLYETYLASDNVLGIINLLNEIGTLFEKMDPHLSNNNLNAIFAYSFAIEKCIDIKHDNLKIDLSIKCGKMAELNSSLKEKDQEKDQDQEYDGELEYDFKQERLISKKLSECNYLESALLIYGIAIEII